MNFRFNFFRKLFILVCPLLALLRQEAFSQGVGINGTGAAPDSKAILDISSPNKGLLIPRMTTAQRDAIAAPPVGLQVYNLSTNMVDIFRGVVWESVSYVNSINVVKVSSLADLPPAVSGIITLDATKIYVVSGMINLSSSAINVNGAALRGNSPAKDGFASNVNGAVLRSTGKSVEVERLTINTSGSATKAYDFTDATGAEQCTLNGCQVTQSIAGLGVGNLSGFNSISLSGNVWACADGIKMSGATKQFVAAFNQITGLSTGSAFEFLAGGTYDYVEFSDNQFLFTGLTGITLAAGVVVDRGRLTVNFFSTPVGTLISGFDSFSAAWEMSQNTRLANSHSYGFIYMNENSTYTTIPAANTYVKVAGATTPVKLQRFTASASNRLTYVGRRNITAAMFVVIGGQSPANGTDIAIARNGVLIPVPNMTQRAVGNNVSFTVSMETEVDLVTGDYIELFIRNVTLTNNILVKDLQMRISD